jgi:hypothetical protein
MKKQLVTVEGSVITVAYPTIKKTVVLDVSKCSAEVREAMLMHGGSQKLGDAASGKSPTEKFDMATRIVESLYAGSWNLESREVDTTAIVVEAVSRIKKLKITKVQEVIDALSEDDAAEKVKDWRSNVKVKAEIAKIRAERAAVVAEESEEDADDIEV